MPFNYISKLADKKRSSVKSSDTFSYIGSLALEREKKEFAEEKRKEKEQQPGYEERRKRQEEREKANKKAIADSKARGKALKDAEDAKKWMDKSEGIAAFNQIKENATLTGRRNKFFELEEKAKALKDAEDAKKWMDKSEGIAAFNQIKENATLTGRRNKFFELEEKAKEKRPMTISQFDKSLERGSVPGNILRAAQSGFISGISSPNSWLNNALTLIRENEIKSNAARHKRVTGKITPESPNQFSKDISTEKVISKYLAKSKDPIKDFLDMNENFVKRKTSELNAKTMQGTSGLEQFLYESVNAVGKMAPSMAMSIFAGRAAVLAAIGTVKAGGLTGATIASTSVKTTAMMKTAASMVTKFKPMIPFMMTAGGNYLQEELDKGTDPYKALLIAFYKGGIEGVTEVAPFGAMMKYLGIKQGAKLVKKGLVKAFAGKSLLALKAYFAEGMQEAIVDPWLKVGDVMIGGEKSPDLFGKGGYVDFETMLDSFKGGIGMAAVSSLFGLLPMGFNAATASYAEKLELSNKIEKKAKTPEGQAIINKAVGNDKLAAKLEKAAEEAGVDVTQKVTPEKPVEEKKAVIGTPVEGGMLVQGTVVPDADVQKIKDGTVVKGYNNEIVTEIKGYGKKEYFIEKGGNDLQEGFYVDKYNEQRYRVIKSKDGKIRIQVESSENGFAPNSQFTPTRMGEVTKDSADSTAIRLALDVESGELTYVGKELDTSTAETVEKKQEPVSRETSVQDGEIATEMQTAETKTGEREIPDNVLRVEDQGDDLGTVEKPQGLYTSDASIDSYLNNEYTGEKKTYSVNKNANVLKVPIDLVTTNRGLAGESAGIGALKALVGEEERTKLLKMSKQELIKELSAKYPDVDFSRYFDAQEILEGYAGILAREQGYDAIFGYDTSDDTKAGDEFVALTEGAFETKTEQVTEQEEGLTEYKDIPQKGYRTPVIKGKEKIAEVQSSGLPKGTFYALDKPFESDVHDVKEAEQVDVPKVKKVFDPDALLDDPNLSFDEAIQVNYMHNKIFDQMVDHLNKTKPSDTRQAMTDFLKSKGFDSYIRGIDGDKTNRELIVFDQKTTPTKEAPTQEETKAAPTLDTWIDTITEDDVDYDFVRQAHSAISFDPEKRAKNYQASYVEKMKEVYTHIKSLAKTEEQKKTAVEELEKYKKNYLRYFNAWVSATGRTMSSMITGPANFPVARNEKRMATENKRMNEFIEWKTKL
jgi:hypothetical protein